MVFKALARQQGRQIFLWALRGTARPSLLYRAPKLATQNLQPPKKLLLIRPDHLGDILLLTPALHLLRQALPQTEITLMVGPWGAASLENNTDFDRLVRCEFPGFSRKPKKSWFEPYLYVLEQSRQLRSYGYDAAINFRHDFWWGALLIYLADLPLRFGYNWPESRQFLTHSLVLPTDSHKNNLFGHSARHAAAMNLALAQKALQTFGVTTPHLPEHALGLRFETSSEDKRYVNLHLSEWGINRNDKVVVIHPGSGATIKLWTAEKFATLADALSERFQMQVILVGGDAEAELLKEISQHAKHEPLVWDTAGLGKLAALFARANLVVGLDSGPLHLAITTDTPTIQLFGPTDPAIFGPWGNPEIHRIVRTEVDLPCLPCGILDFRRTLEIGGYCMQTLKVTQVLDVVDQLINKK